jgi:hypothetical protein
MSPQEEKLRMEAVAARRLERIRERQRTDLMGSSIYDAILNSADPREELIAVSFGNLR